MPKKVTLHSVVVFRNNKRIVVAPNTSFDFTAEEIEQLKASDTEEVKSLRDPIDETGGDPDPSNDAPGDAGKQPAQRGRGAAKQTDNSL